MVRTATVLAAVLVAMAVLLAARPARALENCVSVCDNAYCTVTHDHCIESAPAPAYGAIAYGRQSGAWGTSYHWTSRAEAERVALRNCAPHGNDCETAVWFRDACGAVATGGARIAFWGIGDGIGAARASALGKCRTGGGDRCTIAVSACSR